jgi:hypothetical protein
MYVDPQHGNYFMTLHGACNFEVAGKFSKIYALLAMGVFRVCHLFESLNSTATGMVGFHTSTLRYVTVCHLIQQTFTQNFE